MPTLYPGLLLNDRYQIQRPIGRGGFSVVWLAVDLQSHLSVAVKISLPEKDSASEMPARFEREFQATRHLQHPHLLVAKDCFRYEGSGCLVFDYMANGTLHDKVKTEGVLPEAEVAKVMRQIGGGLEFMHRNHLIHFDVKPENILINAQGDYFLSDFDTASRLENAMVRVSRIYADTPQYRSPEHLRGASELSEKVDVFALGITLFELCEGILEKEFGVGMMMLSGAEKPTFETPGYTERLQQIIHACWNHNPADRPTGEALQEYGRSRLEEGYWPHILEFKADDKAFPDAPLSSNSPTARVTISLREQPPAKPTVPVTNYEHTQIETDPYVADPAPLYEPPRAFSEATVIEQGSTWSSPSPDNEPPPLLTTEKISGRKPLFSLPVNSESKLSNAMKAIIAVVVLLLVVAATFFVLNLRKSGYHKQVEAAQKSFQENKLKAAYESIQEARKLNNGDAPEIKALRLQILDAALTQHRQYQEQVRQYVATGNENDYLLARQLLLDNSDNASILIGQDSTSFFLDLIPQPPQLPQPDTATQKNIASPSSPSSSGPSTLTSSSSKLQPPTTKPSTTKPPAEPQQDPAAQQARQEREAQQARQEREAQLRAQEEVFRRREAEATAERAWLAQADRDRIAREEEDRRRELDELKKKKDADDAARRLREEEERRRTEAESKPSYQRTGTPVGLTQAARNNVPPANRKYIDGKATVSLSPTQPVRLDKAYIAVDNCGVIEVSLSGPGLNASDKIPVSSFGLAEIDLSDMNAKLEKGKTYTLTFSPAEGGRCSMPGKPKIETLPNANSRNSDQLTLRHGGGAFLYDLKYKY